ncbi:MAG: glycosyltransferase [Nanoarchaeota archaeon]
MANKIGIVYGYLVKHGGISRYISEIIKRIENPERFDIMALESNIRLPKKVKLDILETERDKSFMSSTENNLFSESVKRMIDDSDFYVLHSHGVYNFSPDIYTPHICLKEYFNSIKNFFGEEVFWQNFGNAVHLLETEKNMVKKLDNSAIFPVSNKVSRELRINYDISARKIAPGSSRFPISRKNISRCNYRIKKIGFIGNNIYSKGLVFLKPALNKLSKKGIDIECISAGTDKEVDRYMDSENFKYTPIGKNSVDESFYKNLDCFICLSTYEAYSLSTLEAMSQGVPVVSSDLNGVFFDKSLQGETFLSQLRNIDDLEEVESLMEKILKKKKFRKNIVDQQIDFSLQNSWQSTADIYEKVYSSF